LPDIGKLLPNVRKKRRDVSIRVLSRGCCGESRYSGSWWVRAVRGGDAELLGHAFKVLYAALGKHQSDGSKVESETTTIAAIPLTVLTVVFLAVSRRPLDTTRGGPVGSRLLILTVVAVHAEPQQERIAVPGLSRRIHHDHRPTTRRAHLLSLQPAFETTEMKDMATGQLLGAGPLHLPWVGCIPGMHLFSANNACILASKLLGRRVGIPVHVLEGLLIPQ
jgi:hypothetical protein